MADPVIAKRGSFPVRVLAGNRYSWCRCGRSATQPFCDGSHADSGISPLVWTADETEVVYFCGCKHTQDQPFCDGHHKAL